MFGWRENEEGWEVVLLLSLMMLLGIFQKLSSVAFKDGCAGKR